MTRQEKRQRARQYAKLEALYARLPSIACKGLCAEACGPIAMTTLERERIEDETGREILPMVVQDLTCPYLEEGTNRCLCYEARPAICRIWGVSTKLRCPHGCTPERWPTEAEIYALLAAVAVLGGEEHWIAPPGWQEEAP